MESSGRDVKKLIMGYGFTLNFSSGITSPFLSVFIFEIAGESFLKTGIGNQVPTIISIVMGYIWARISDYTGKRRIFIQMALGTGIITTTALSFVRNVEQYLVIQTIGSITGSAGGAALSAVIAENFRGSRGELFGRYQAITVIGGFLGNVISGALYNAIGYRNVLRLVATLNIIPLTIISLIPENAGKKFVKGKLFSPPKIPSGFWKAYGIRLMLTLPGALSGGLLGIYYLKYLGGSPENWSIVVAITTFLGLSSIPYGKLADKLSMKSMFTFAGIGWTILYLGYYLSPTPTIFALFFIIPIWPAFWITYNKLLMELSDSTDRVTFYAFEGILSTILGAIVGIFSGYLADLFGPRNIFILSASIAATATVYTRIILKRKSSFSESP